MPRPRAVSSVVLLAFLMMAAVLPLAARGSDKGCHCPVKMACCEDGTCTMGGDEPPADGPEWRTCRREAAGTAPSPLDAFERALTSSNEVTPQRPVTEAAAVDPCRLASTASGPTSPPPRVFSF